MSTAHQDQRILQGLATQLARRRARLDRGEKSLGWKVGFGAPAAMELLEIDAPLVGFLTDKTLLDPATAAAVPIGSWIRAAVEPEIAVYFGRDLSGSPDRETVRAAVAAIGPAFELADVELTPRADQVEAILAGNVFNRYVFPGRPDKSRAGCVLDGLVGRISREGEEMPVVTDLQALTGDLIEIVRHVTGLLSIFGEKMRAGELIITGSIVPPLWVTADERIRYTLDPLDALEIGLTADHP